MIQNKLWKNMLLSSTLISCFALSHSSRAMEEVIALETTAPVRAKSPIREEEVPDTVGKILEAFKKNPETFQEFVEAFRKNPETLQKFLEAIKETSTDPVLTKKNTAIVEGINNLSYGSKKLSNFSYYLGLITSYAAPILKFFHYEGAAEMAREINSYAKKTGGACKITYGLCDSITEENPLHCLHSVAGIAEIFGAHMQESAEECAKTVSTAEQMLKEAEDNIAKLDKVECKDAPDIQALKMDFQHTVQQSKQTISSLSEKKLRYQCGSFICSLSDKIAKQSFDDLENAQKLQQNLPKVLIGHVISAVTEEIVTNPEGTMYVGREVKDRVSTIIRANQYQEQEK